MFGIGISRAIVKRGTPLFAGSESTLIMEDHTRSDLSATRLSDPNRVGMTGSRTATAWLAAAFAAVGIGLLSGFACAAVRSFFGLLQWALTQHGGTLPAAAASLSPVRRVLTPAAGAILGMGVLWAARRWTPADRFEEYVEAVRFRGGHIPFRSTAWRTLSSAFSIATGAAVGREGSMIQFAAALVSFVAERLPNGVSLPRLVACGVAAAVAAAYQAPIAGICFASEIVIGEWRWVDLPWLALAAFAGLLASRGLLESGPLFPVETASVLSRQLLWALPLAVLLGIAAPGYQKLLRALRFASGWRLPLLWSGLAVGAFSLLQPAVWGNGDGALTEVLHQASLQMVVSVLLLRLLATTLCVGTGTVGGVFTPTLFAGAAAGFIAGHFVGVSQPALFAVAGLSSFMSGVTHAPFMASFLAAELTGQWHMWPVLLCLDLVSCWVSQKLSAHSLYAIATPEPNQERRL